MKNAFLPIIIFFALLISGISKAEPTAQDLPSDVSNIENNIGALDQLYESLQRIPADDSATLAWLDKQTWFMPPIFLYEYSRRLNVAGKRGMALIHLARARLERDIDSSECIKRDRNTPGDFWFTLTNQIEFEILHRPKASKEEWLSAISLALETYAAKKRTSPLWLCGANNIKDAEAATESRKQRYEFLKQDFEKMRGSPSSKQ